MTFMKIFGSRVICGGVGVVRGGKEEECLSLVDVDVVGGSQVLIGESNSRINLRGWGVGGGGGLGGVCFMCITPGTAGTDPRIFCSRAWHHTTGPQRR